MKKKVKKTGDKKNISLNLPVTVNKENWNYWWECLVLPWCFSDWNSLDEYSRNMWNAVHTYVEWIEEWFFDVSNIWFLKFNLSENGEVSSNFMKKVDWSSYKELSYS